MDTNTDITKLKETKHIRNVRADFPILNRKINGRPLIYLDNAATSQKPKAVIDALLDFYTNHNSNIHRAIHTLGAESTEMYEAARKKTAGFINASPREIVFTKNTSESLNLLAYSLGSALQKGDEIITTIMEHHSNIVPWQMLRSKGVKLNFVDINNEGFLNTGQLEEMLTKKTKIVTMTQVSNILGTINKIREIGKIVHGNGAILAVDGAQSAPHMPVDVNEMDADFFAFSSHKMLGPAGLGVLYGKKDLLEGMQPFMYGGDMIAEVTMEKTTFNQVPQKFEAGTPSIADAVAFGAAVDYLCDIGMQSVRDHERGLTEYALAQMKEIGVKVYGPAAADVHAGVISFNIDGVHPHDVASILDERGIAIRTGHGCAMPLMKRLGVESVCRASFYIYNTREEVDALISGIRDVKRIFRIS